MDQFYTKPEISEKIYNKLNEIVSLNEFDIHFEPSAGKGSFFCLMNSDKRKGIDIDPKCEGIEKMDFFRFEPEIGKKYIAIGNPPFGKNGHLCVRFFNKCALFCDCIAFIVPRTFKRVSVQNKLNMNFKLNYNEDLPMNPCCFTPKMSAKCCFQIWVKSCNDAEIEQRKKVILQKVHPHFSFLKYGPKDEKNQPTPPQNADFALKAYGANCGEIKTNNLHILRPKSWHWIKANIDASTLKENFKSLDYSLSKDTVRQDSLGQQELIHIYNEKYCT